MDSFAANTLQGGTIIHLRRGRERCSPALSAVLDGELGVVQPVGVAIAGQHLQVATRAAADVENLEQLRGCFGTARRDGDVGFDRFGDQASPADEPPVGILQLVHAVVFVDVHVLWSVLAGCQLVRVPRREPSYQRTPLPIPGASVNEDIG